MLAVPGDRARHRRLHPSGARHQRPAAPAGACRPRWRASVRHRRAAGWSGGQHRAGAAQQPVGVGLVCLARDQRSRPAPAATHAQSRPRAAARPGEAAVRLPAGRVVRCRRPSWRAAGRDGHRRSAGRPRRRPRPGAPGATIARAGAVDLLDGPAGPLAVRLCRFWPALHAVAAAVANRPCAGPVRRGIARRRQAGALPGGGGREGPGNPDGPGRQATVARHRPARPPAAAPTRDPPGTGAR